MANELIVQDVPMSAPYGWSGVLSCRIDHNPENETGTASVTMVIYESQGGSPKEGYYNCYVQIVKDGNVLNSRSWEGETYLTDFSSGGIRLTCSASFSYKDSCNLSINGWAICYSGPLSGSSVEGSRGWPLKAYKPPTPIVTDREEVQMGNRLLISLNRAYEDYTHTLYYQFGTGLEQKMKADVSSSYTWEVPDMANLCTNATSGSCTLRAVTYKGYESGGNVIGETRKTIQITVQDPTTPAVDADQVTLGQLQKISCKRNSQYFTQKLKLQFYGQTFPVWEGSEDQADWTPGYDMAKLIPNLSQGTGTLQCVTMNGTAEVGTGSVTIRVIVPENEVTKPVFSLENMQIMPVSDLPEDYEGLYIRGRTGLKAQMEASSEYSTIAKYELTVGSLKQEGNPAVFELLVNDGTVEVTAKVTDSRGYSRSVKTSVYVYSYRNPKVVPYSGYSEVICQRAASTGELTAGGTFLAIRAGKSFSSIVVNGQEKNSCSLRYRWKRNGTPEFSQWIDLLPEGSAENSISTLIGNVVGDLKTSYTVEITATDELRGEHTLAFQIMTDAISFVLYDGPDGAGFGKYPEEPHVVDIASHMTLLVRGKLVVSTADWVDLELAEGVRESVYSYGRKEYSSCYYLVSNGNNVHVAFNCGLTYNGTAVIINKRPIPEEFRPKQSVFSLCAMNGRCVAMVSTSPDGFVRLEWVQNLENTGSTGTQEVIWIDGYLDHWT